MTVTYLTAKEINFRKKAVDITLSLDADYWDNESERVEAIQKLIGCIIELTENDDIYYQVFERNRETREEKIKIDGRYKFKY